MKSIILLNLQCPLESEQYPKFSLKNWEYTPEQTFEDNSSEIRYSTIKGHKIKHDNWADFIKVKDWDTKSELKLLLSNAPEYSYLKNKKYTDMFYNLDAKVQINKK